MLGSLKSLQTGRERRSGEDQMERKSLRYIKVQEAARGRPRKENRVLENNQGEMKSQKPKKKKKRERERFFRDWATV